MTTPSASTPPVSNGLRSSGLKSLAVAIGVTALAATGAWAAQHEPKPQESQSQQMPGPSFERMQEMMQQGREAKNPAERRTLMRQHMQMMSEKMQTMRGMMGDMSMQGRMGDGQTSSGPSKDTSGGRSGQMPQMDVATPEMMTRLRERQGMMEQMMEQMLEQQKMMMDMGEQR